MKKHWLRRKTCIVRESFGKEQVKTEELDWKEKFLLREDFYQNERVRLERDGLYLKNFI